MTLDDPAPQVDGAAAETSVDAALRPFDEALRDRFPSREALLAEARAQTDRSRHKRTRPQVIASAVLAVIAAMVVVLDPALSTRELRADLGQRLETVLDDGDRVTLDSASIVRASTHLRSRQLTLVRGEVLVSAAPDWRPLTVHAAGARIVDTGTVFSVRLDSAPFAASQVLALQVAVLEGSVEVAAEAGAASRGAPMPVRAGEALRLLRAPDAADGRRRMVDDIAWPRGVAAPIDVDRALAWRRGKLMFDGTPLAQAVTEMQRYRAAPIRLLDARIAGLRLSGEFDIDGVDALLDDLALSLPVSVTRAADGSVAIAAR